MSVGRGVVSTVGLVFAPIVALYVLNVDTHPLARPANLARVIASSLILEVVTLPSAIVLVVTLFDAGVFIAVCDKTMTSMDTVLAGAVLNVNVVPLVE